MGIGKAPLYMVLTLRGHHCIRFLKGAATKDIEIPDSFKEQANGCDFQLLA
jgi:hypothetical protein